MVNSQTISNRELEQQPKLLEMIFDHMAVALAIFDQNQALLRFNRAWADLIARHTPHSMEQIRPGMGLFTLHPHLEEKFLPLLAQVQAGQAVYQQAVCLPGEGGDYYWNVSLAPFEENLILIITDVKGPSSTSSSINVAILEERTKLARELHDNLAQTLGYLKVRLSTIEQLLQQGQIEESQANLRQLKIIAGEIYTDIREEIFNLRSAASTEKNFLELLRNYVARYKKFYTLDVNLVLEVDESVLDLPPETGLQLIRIIQEALINVRKHSGTDQAVIRFSQQQAEMCISVEDEGEGFDREAVKQMGESNFGLQIMNERAQSIGGYLEIDAIPGDGAKVIIRLPLSTITGQENYERK